MKLKPGNIVKPYLARICTDVAGLQLHAVEIAAHADRHADDVVLKGEQ